MSSLARQAAKEYSQFKRLVNIEPIANMKNRTWEKKIRTTFLENEKKYSAYEAKTVDELFTFTKSHQELMDRYFGPSGMTQAERIQKTAHRVGLQVPQYMGATDDNLLSATADAAAKKKALKEKASKEN